MDSETDERSEAFERGLKTMERVALELYQRGRASAAEELESVKRERDEARAERDNLLDTRSEGAWMARALDAERMAAEAEKLSDAAKAAWDAECIMREQRDRFHAEWKQERQEVERLRIALLEVQTSESAAAWFADGFHDGWKAGAEAMREACARWMSEREGIAQWVYDDALSALPIPEEP